MSDFNARWTKRTALGFFWLALTGFLATTGGGRKRNFTSTSIHPKTTQLKRFGFLEGTTATQESLGFGLITEAPFEAVETITHETLGK